MKFAPSAVVLIGVLMVNIVMSFVQSVLQANLHPLRKRCNQCPVRSIPVGRAKERIFFMFESVIKQQESMLAAENLAGNVVKAEFHKGALYALRLVEAVYEEARHNTKESPGTDLQQPLDTVVQNGHIAQQPQPKTVTPSCRDCEHVKEQVECLLCQDYRLFSKA